MARPRPARDGPSLSTVQAIAIASQFGVTLAVAVGLGLFVGQWLDGQLHTSFVFTLIGVFLGLGTAAASTVTAYRVLQRQRPRAPRPGERHETPDVDETEG